MRLNAFEKLNALNCFIFFVYLQRFFAFSHYHLYQWKVLVLAQCWHFGRHKNIGSHDSRHYTMSVFSQLTSIRAERALLSALCPDVAFEHRRIALIVFYHSYYCFIYFIMPICLSFERFIYTNIFSSIIQLVYINLEFFQYKLAIFSQISSLKKA